MKTYQAPTVSVIVNEMENGALGQCACACYSVLMMIF